MPDLFYPDVLGIPDLLCSSVIRIPDHLCSSVIRIPDLVCSSVIRIPDLFYSDVLGIPDLLCSSDPYTWPILPWSTKYTWRLRLHCILLSSRAWSNPPSQCLTRYYWLESGFSHLDLLSAAAWIVYSLQPDSNQIFLVKIWFISSRSTICCSLNIVWYRTRF